MASIVKQSDFQVPVLDTAAELCHGRTQLALSGIDPFDYVEAQFCQFTGNGPGVIFFGFVASCCSGRTSSLPPAPPVYQLFRTSLGELRLPKWHHQMHWKQRYGCRFCLPAGLPVVILVFRPHRCCLGRGRVLKERVVVEITPLTSICIFGTVENAGIQPHFRFVGVLRFAQPADIRFFSVAA